MFTFEAVKKILVAIIAILYLGSSSGATLHLHYCMGELMGATVELGQQADKICDSCGMPKSQAAGKGCCKDEHKAIQLSKDQKAAAAYMQLLQSAVAVEPQSYPDAAAVQLAQVVLTGALAHAPPGTGQPPLFIRNCVFRV